MFFGFEILVGVFVGVLIATIVVLVLNIRTTSQVNKMTFPAYEYAMKKAEHDAEGLLSDARKNARKIITEAEKAGHETISKYTDQAEDIHEKFEVVIAEQTKNIGVSLHEASGTHLQALKSMLASTEAGLLVEQKKVIELVGRTSAGLEAIASRAEHHAKDTAESLQDRITEVSQTIESRLLRAEAKGEDTLTAHLESLQKTADNHVAAYEVSRIKLMDAHVEQLVESVVVQVLHAQLPISEHTSLARKALEEAKAKHIL